jgi:hypothetical protein
VCALKKLGIFGGNFGRWRLKLLEWLKWKDLDLLVDAWMGIMRLLETVDAGTTIGKSEKAERRVRR